MRNIDGYRYLYEDEPPAGDPPAGDPPAGDPPALPEGAFYSDNRFRDALPEELRGHASLAKVTDMEGLVRGYLSAQSMIGKDPLSLVEVPSEVTPETRKPILDKLGLPADAGTYKLEAPEGTTEALMPDTPLGKIFTDTAHKMGIFPDQAQGLYATLATTLTEARNTEHQKLVDQDVKNEATMKGEWGDTFDQRIARATWAADQLGIREDIEGAGLGATPSILKALFRISEVLGEDSSETGTQGRPGGPSGMTPDEHRSQAKALQQQAINEKNPAEKRRLSEEANRHWAAVDKSVIG